MTSKLRSRLTLSALATASSFVALAAPAHAQSVCTLSTTTLTCLDGTTATVSGTVGGTGTITTTPGGLQVASTGTLAVGTSGTVTVPTGPAVVLSSTGNLAVTAGATTPLNTVVTGNGPGVTLSSGGRIDAALGSISTVNDYALKATAGTGASISTGAITATNVTTADLAMPLFGTSGGGALVTTTTGDALLTVNGPLRVTGSTNPLVGAAVYAPAGTANAQVKGDVTVTSTASPLGFAVGVGAVGANATVGVTGTTLVTGAGATGLAAFATPTVAGTGNAIITCGNVTAGSLGTSGAVGTIATGTTASVTCGNVTALGTNATGVDAEGATSATVNVGTVTTAGTGSDGIYAAGGTGSVTVNSGLVSSGGTGIFTRSGANAGAGVTGTVITVAGVNATGNGIDAGATGTAPISITATAPVTSTTGIGILATGTSGAITIREAGANGRLGGVKVVATGAAPVSVTAIGGTTTSTGADAINIATGGAATVTVASGATVSGQQGFDAIEANATGGTTVQVNGVVTSAPAYAGYAVRALGGPAAVTVGTGGQLNGNLLLTAGNDSVSNSGVFNAYGATDFGLGTDSLTNQSGGSLILNNGASFAGLETLSNSGALYVNGTSTLTGTNIANNASGTIYSTAGAGTLAGIGTLTNAGLITMVNGATTDTLTVGGNYVGANGKLAVDVNPALNAADKLIVTGNISGTTTVSTNLTSGNALYNPTGVVIVDGNGTATTGAFVLAPASQQVGFLNYTITQSGNNYLLTNSLDASVVDLALVGSIGQEMWYQSFDAYHDAIMGRHAGSLTSGHNIGIWGQLYESKDKYGDDSGRTASIGGTSVSFGDRIKTHRRGGQVGLEYRGPGWVIGATGGYEWARTEDDPVAAQLGAEGHNYGAYALFGTGNGFYAGLMYKRDDYKVRFANAARNVAFRNSAHSDGVDGEVGFKGGTSAMMFDLNAGLSWVKSNIDPWNQYGLNFDWDSNKSLRGRLGARVIFPAAAGAFLGAKVFHEFKNDGELIINSGSTVVGAVDMPNRGTWVRLEGGLGAVGNSGVLVTVWGDLGDTKSIGGRVGFRF